ncbi:unnamed protein product [Musa hybrid cultivar]
MSIGLTLFQKGFDKVIEKGEAKLCRKKFPKEGDQIDTREEEAKVRWNGERGNRR